MIDNIKLANYKSFFADQVKEAIDEQQKINRSQMRNLFKTGELSLAYVDSIQHETGMIILKCPRRMAPRLKVLKGVCIIKKGAKQALGEHVTEWICRWEEFVDNKDFHSPGSDMTPMYYVHTGDSNYDYVACSGFSIKLYDILSKALADGKSLSLIVHNPFPPVEYFRNLETNLLKELQTGESCIISCGGGVALRQENVVEMKKNGRVVLLTASPETIYERVKDSNDRPILEGNKNVEFIADMMEKRREKYEAAADVVVQTDNKTILQICEELISKLMELDEK